jgi:hypothetical protein
MQDRDNHYRSTLLVLVHFGKKIPRLVRRNIAYLRKLFPENTIVLITDSEKVSRLKFPNLRILRPTIRNDWVQILERIPLGSFRKGFWKKVVLRLLALEILHDFFPLNTNVLHLESDMLIFKDFPFREIASSGYSIAWMSFDEDIDMPALIFGSVGSFQWLSNEIRQVLQENPRINDMQALFLVRSRNRSKVGTLPTVQNGQCVIGEKLEPATVQVSGVFDPAYYGQWFIGEQPRNRWGWIVRKRRLRSFLDLNSVSLSVVDDGVELTYSHLSSERLFSIHIHSKEARFFGSQQQRHLARRSASRKRRIFSLSGFVLRAIDFILDGANFIRRGFGL